MIDLVRFMYRLNKNKNKEKKVKMEKSKLEITEVSVWYLDPIWIFKIVIWTKRQNKNKWMNIVTLLYWIIIYNKHNIIFYLILLHNIISYLNSLSTCTWDYLSVIAYMSYQTQILTYMIHGNKRNSKDKNDWLVLFFRAFRKIFYFNNFSLLRKRSV